MSQPVITLSADEMLQRWKLLGLYEPLLDGASVECSPGVDLDNLIMMQIDNWYARQLSTAPLEILPLTDIADTLTPVRLPDGAAGVSLPPSTITVASVMMEGWQQPATIITNPDSPRARAQSNPFCRGRYANPVAILFPDLTLKLYTPPPGPMSLISLKTVAMPPKGTYTLTPAMLSQMPAI